jgi:tRNA wybutosine-synthesizing protein 4
VIFVDIDYPELIAKKVRIIKETPRLLELLGAPAICKNEEGILLRTKHYIALGCDLANTATLSDALINEIVPHSCRVLCMAEISITYMDTAAADSLIRWTSSLPDGTKTAIPVSFPSHGH